MTKLFFVLAGGLIFVEIIFINQLAGFGQIVSAIDRQIEALREENLLLEQKIASTSSLFRIEQKAREYGFTEAKPSSYLHLEEQMPLAFEINQ